MSHSTTQAHRKKRTDPPLEAGVGDEFNAQLSNVKQSVLLLAQLAVLGALCTTECYSHTGSLKLDLLWKNATTKT